MPVEPRLMGVALLEARAGPRVGRQCRERRSVRHSATVGTRSLSRYAATSRISACRGAPAIGIGNVLADRWLYAVFIDISMASQTSFRFSRGLL